MCIRHIYFIIIYQRQFSGICMMSKKGQSTRPKCLFLLKVTNYIRGLSPTHPLVSSRKSGRRKTHHVQISRCTQVSRTDVASSFAAVSKKEASIQIVHLKFNTKKKASTSTNHHECTTSKISQGTEARIWTR